MANAFQFFNGNSATEPSCLLDSEVELLIRAKIHNRHDNNAKHLGQTFADTDANKYANKLNVDNR